MTNFNYYIARSTAGKIGKQAQAGTDPLKLPGNKFLPSVSVPRLYSMNSSTDTVQTFRYNSLPIWAAYSTPASLSIRDSVTSRVIPVITSGLEPYTWAATDSSCIPMSYLVDSYGGDSSRTEMAMLIINSELIGTTEEITQNYEAKDFLYEDMITDSGKFVWNDTLHNFKTDYELSDAFQLKEAEKQLSTKDNETGISTLESTITPIEPMENMKEILMLQADNMPLDTGTEKFDAVEALAYSCPYSYGKAVYYARALLISRFGYLDFDDETLCMHADYSNCRRINPNPTMEDNKFDVVPNPLANSFAIQNNTDKLIQDIKIFDIIGRCILTTQAQNIDFSKYSSGRYFIEVQYTDQSKQVKLFIKE
jgi:hypothetical protein